MGDAIIYVVLDGVGDRPTPSHQNKTPLEAASTPNLDGLARSGMMGLVYTVKKGIAPESDAGVFSLLSYDPSKLDLSRGVIEAIGIGIEFNDGDLALRCNFATVQDDKIIDRRAGRNISKDEASRLVEALRADTKLRDLGEFELETTIGHRCVLLFRGNGTEFSDSVSNLDPAYERKGKITIAKALRLPTPIPRCRALNRTRTALRTAALINRFAKHLREVLEGHPVNLQRKQRGDRPANFLLMRDAGTKMPRVRTLKEKFGFRSVALADLPVELGIAKVVGMDVEAFGPDRTREGYLQRATRVRELAAHYDLVYVHLKGPDELGHDGDFDGKTKSVEDIDAGFFAHLADTASALFCVTADHATPCTAMRHTDDPVPILMSGRNVKPNGSMRFTESYGRKGRIGTLRHGHEILKMLKKLS